MGLRDGLKSKVGAAVHHFGALRLVQKLNQNGVRILMYHRFPREHATNFDRQCEFLAEHYQVVPLAEAVSRLKAGDSLASLAVITVDDGYADVHEVALPVLRKHRLPATLFVTTGFVDHTCWMPGDRVRYHFAQTTDATVKVTDDAGQNHLFGTRDGEGAQRLRSLLKRVPHATRSRILSGLLGGDAPEPAVASRDEFRPCTWDQIRELAESQVSIGAHTVTHAILSRLQTEKDTREEILSSKSRLEEELGRAVDLFAYPNGLPEDVSDASFACVRENFRGAVMASFGLNAPGADVFQLRRLGCEPSVPVPDLARMLAGPLRGLGTDTRPMEQR